MTSDELSAALRLLGGVGNSAAGALMLTAADEIDRLSIELEQQKPCRQRMTVPEQPVNDSSANTIRVRIAVATSSGGRWEAAVTRRG